MKIKKVVEPRKADTNQKPGFWQWVIFSSKAYQITMIIAFISPPLLFGTLIAIMVLTHNFNFILVMFTIMLLVSLYNLYRQRWIFKFTPDDNIATAIYGKILGKKSIQIKGEEMLDEQGKTDT